MLVVLCSKVDRDYEYPMYRSVNVWMEDEIKLTPTVARKALQLSGYITGTATYESVDRSGENHYRKTYRVYPNSVKLLYDGVD